MNTKAYPVQGVVLLHGNVIDACQSFISHFPHSMDIQSTDVFSPSVSFI